MRILLTNHDMTYPGGTQAWVKTMARELAKDHEVDLHVHSGRVPTWIPNWNPAKHYDLALMNHFPCFRNTLTARIDTRILTSHGVIPAEEWPSWGADAYASVSEAVASHIPFKSTVIRNPIDLERFYPRRKVNSRLKRIAFVSNRQGKSRQLVEEVASLMPDVDFRFIGKDNVVTNPEDIYDWADLVIGIARVAIEALACGRNVLALDYLGYHGRVDRDNLPAMYATNFGGHSVGTWPRATEVVTTLRTYDPNETLSELIRETHAPTRIASSYLNLAESVPHYQKQLARLVRSVPALTSPKVSKALSRLNTRQSNKLS